jgi:4a-hydroxytetrahydrobiopterin dehydratase
MERKSEDRLGARQVEEMLRNLEGWTQDKESITKTFVRKNFLDAVAMVQQIAGIAEHMDHHPDILLSDYKNLKVMLTTHSAGGITQNDIDLARAIEQLTNR